MIVLSLHQSPASADMPTALSLGCDKVLLEGQYLYTCCCLHYTQRLFQSFSLLRLVA